MATTSLWPIKMTINKTINYVENKDKTKIPLSDLSNTIEYASNKDKTEKQYYVTGINCDENSIYQDMMMVKEAYNKMDKIQGFHGFQSFKEGEVTPEEAHKIGVEFANEMWGDNFQVVVTTHLNTNHLHNHFVVNAVSFKDGHKYNYSNSEMARLRRTNDTICEEHGLSFLEEKKTKKIDFNYYKNKDNYSIRTKADIDTAIKNSFSYQDFILYMKKNNYEVIERYGKLSVRNLNKKRNIRIERQFGEEYSIENINRRIIEEVPDKLSNDDLIEFTKAKNNYHKYRHSLIALFIYYCLRINIYQKSPRNYPISEEMKKDINKLELYNLEIRFMTENKINLYEEFQCYKEVCKEVLDDLIYVRKRTYEEKSKSNDSQAKSECDMKIDFYNESIKEFQTKVKTCNAIEENNKKILTIFKLLNNENVKNVNLYYNSI